MVTWYTQPDLLYITNLYQRALYIKSSLFAYMQCKHQKNFSFTND